MVMMVRWNLLCAGRTGVVMVVISFAAIYCVRAGREL